jgi:hypothetical protein
LIVQLTPAEVLSLLTVAAIWAVPFVNTDEGGAVEKAISTAGTKPPPPPPQPARLKAETTVNGNTASRMPRV